MQKFGNSYVVNLTHRESLGKILASSFGTAYRTDIIQFLVGQGQSFCFDSLHNDSRIFYGKNVTELLEDLSKKNNKLYLVIDEFNQVLNHLLNANTEIEFRRNEVILNFQKLIQYIVTQGGELIISDADLCDLDLRFLADLALVDYEYFKGLSTVIDNTYNNDLWPVTLFEDIEEAKGKDTKGIDLFRVQVRSQLVEKFKTQDDRPIVITTTVQKVQFTNGTIIISKWLENEIKNLPFSTEGQATKVLRIDSETLGETGHPAIDFVRLNTAYNSASDVTRENHKKALDNLLKDYAVIVVSPSLETGISIQENIKFRAVFGYFGGNTPCNNFVQSLCRVRDNCPRYLFINGFSQNSKSRGYGIHYQDKIENLGKDNDALRIIFERAKFAIKDECKLAGSGIDITYHWSKINEITDVGLMDTREIIYDILTKMGCQIDIFKVSEKDQEKLNDEVSIVKSTINETRDTEVFKDAVQTKEADKLTKNEYDSLTKQTRKTLHKCERLALKRFDNVTKFGDELMDKNDSQWILFGDKFSNIYGKLRLEYILRNYDVATKLDAINKNKSKTDYDGTIYSLKSMAYQYLKVFEIIDSDQELSNDHPLIREAINNWAKQESNVKRVTGLNLNQDWATDPIRFLGKILKSVGYKFELSYKNDDVRRYRVVRAFSKKLTIDQMNNPIYHGCDRINEERVIEYISQDEINLVMANIKQRTEELINAHSESIFGQVMIA